MRQRSWFKTMSGRQDAVQAIYTRGRVLILVALTVIACSLVAADAGAQQRIGFERQVLHFAPSRADLTIGIVWFTVFTPDEDWTVSFRMSKEQTSATRVRLSISN